MLWFMLNTMFWFVTKYRTFYYTLLNKDNLTKVKYTRRITSVCFCFNIFSRASSAKEKHVASAFYKARETNAIQIVRCIWYKGHEKRRILQCILRCLKTLHMKRICKIYIYRLVRFVLVIFIVLVKDEKCISVSC